MSSQYKPHPVSVAFCDAMTSVLSQTKNSMEKQKQHKHSNNTNKMCSSTCGKDNDVLNLPLRIDGHGRRLPVVTSHLFTDCGNSESTSKANNKG